MRNINLTAFSGKCFQPFFIIPFLQTKDDVFCSYSLIIGLFTELLSHCVKIL